MNTLQRTPNPGQPLVKQVAKNVGKEIAKCAEEDSKNDREVLAWFNFHREERYLAGLSERELTDGT